MSTYQTILQFKKMLQNLDVFLEAGVAHAKKKSFDPNVLLTLRLAPDQYPLVRQIQSGCDAAKSAAANLAGKEVPKHPDTETTIEEIKARIQTVITYLGTFTGADFEGAADREVRLSFIPGKYITGADYLDELAVPNFYFHITTAYSILRHNGAELGKTQYIGSMNMKDDKQA